MYAYFKQLYKNLCINKNKINLDNDNLDNDELDNNDILKKKN